MKMIKNIVLQVAKKYGKDVKDVTHKLEIARKLCSEKTKEIKVNNSKYIVKKTAMGLINTSNGKFYQLNFEVSDKWRKYIVLTKSHINEDEGIPVFDPNKDVYLRIDSGCEPGHIFNDRNCDCKSQFEMAIKYIGKSEQGLLIYIPNQEGRGKGSNHHLAALYLQDELGVDTVESFSLLEGNLDIENLDTRTYNGAIAILNFLGLRKNMIRYGTNNPMKIIALERNGFKIKREPLIAPRIKHIEHHLQAKKKVLKHML